MILNHSKVLYPYCTQDSMMEIHSREGYNISYCFIVI